MSEKQRKCEICEKEFINTNSTVRTCGKDCSYKLRSKERYQTQHESVEKHCVSCDQIFLDKSKKKMVTKCTSCFRKEGVEKRRNNGSYVRTKEQNEKLSVTRKRMIADGTWKMSDEAKQRLSKGLSERWESEAFREKVKQGYVRNYGVEHHMKTETSRSQSSARNKGKKLSDEACRKMRASAAKRIREGRNKVQFFGLGGFREDIGFYVRSRWEANFARYLKHTEQNFEYEPVSFTLNDGRTYTPDFKIGDTFYEVKGWWTAKAKEKFFKFREQFPHINVKIVDAKEYNLLELEFGHQIINWEFKNAGRPTKAT